VDEEVDAVTGTN